MRRKQKRSRKRPKTTKPKGPSSENFANEEETPPRSFIIGQGDIGGRLHELLEDFKRVMKPNTAEKIKARKSNKISDFVSMAGPLKVTHLIIFNISDHGPNLKLCRLPQGPSLTFRIEEHSLSSEVLSSLKVHMTHSEQYLTAPCLMTNIQPENGENHLRLCAKILLDMFPNIDPNRVKLRDIKRCCLFNYDAEKEVCDFRHYAIRTQPIGISKAVKKLAGKKVPNLNNLTDISDFVLKAEMLSDSEGEEDSKNNVTLNKKETKGKISATKSYIKLSELGPRLTLKLIKVEEGLCTGTVLYHKHYSKAPEEILEIEKKKEEALKLKEKRRKQQMENVKRKLKEKEEHKKKCLEGMRKKMALMPKEEQDDDVQHYRDEVGEEPDQDLFLKSSKREAEYRNEKKFKKRKTSHR